MPVLRRKEIRERLARLGVGVLERETAGLKRYNVVMLRRR